VGRRDLWLSALVPFYGAIAGLIAFAGGHPRRGRVMLRLATANTIVIVLVFQWLSR
jgi:hypothetical protein